MIKLILSVNKSEEKVEAGVGNPLLANLKAKRGINPGFNSMA